jgi:uncharacterized protein (DUF2141 family)
MRLALCLLAVAFLAAAPAAHAATAILTVRLQHVSGKGGMVRVGLYDRATYALADDRPIMSRDVPAKPGETVVTFNGLTPGDYALKAMQDFYGDSQMHFFMGVPTEPYGFSNDPVIVMSQPSFDATKIAVREGENVTTLTLH